MTWISSKFIIQGCFHLKKQVKVKKSFIQKTFCNMTRKSGIIQMHSNFSLKKDDLFCGNGNGNIQFKINKKIA